MGLGIRFILLPVPSPAQELLVCTAAGDGGLSKKT